MKINKTRTHLPWAPVHEAKSFERSPERIAENQVFYNSKDWRMTSKSRLMDNPLCEVCREAGRLKEASLTDHLIPIEQGGDRFDDRNLMSMCHRCHNRKSGKERHAGALIQSDGRDGEKLPSCRDDIFKILNG